MNSDESSSYEQREVEPGDLKTSANQRSERDQAPLPKRPWAEEEDELLTGLIARDGAQNWSQLSKSLSDRGFKRMGKQCRERWYNHLDPTVIKGPWTEDEDALILRLHNELGNKWTVIADRLPGRPANSIKNHWNSTLKRRIDESPPPARKTPREPDPEGSAELEDSPPIKRRRVRKPRTPISDTPTIVSPSATTTDPFAHSPDAEDGDGDGDGDLDSTNSYESRGSVSYTEHFPPNFTVPEAARTAVPIVDKKIIHHGRTMYIHKDGSLSVVNAADGSLAYVPQPYFGHPRDGAEEPRHFDPPPSYDAPAPSADQSLTFDLYSGYVMGGGSGAQWPPHEPDYTRAYSSAEPIGSELTSYGGQIYELRETWESL